MGRIDLQTKEITKYQIPTDDVPLVPGVGADGVLHIITHGPGNTIVFNEPLPNKIGTIDVFTKQFREYTIPTPLALPIGMAEDPDGNIWFTESGTHKFGRITPSTGAIQEFDVLALRKSLLTLGLGMPYRSPAR